MQKREINTLRKPRDGRPSTTSRAFKDEYLEQYAAYETLYAPYPVPTRALGTWVLEREHMSDTPKNRAKIRDICKTFHPGGKTFNEQKYAPLLNVLREKYKNQITHDLKSDSRLISQLTNHVYRRLIEAKGFRTADYTDLLKTQLEIRKYFDEKERLELEGGKGEIVPTDEDEEFSVGDMEELEKGAKELGLLE